MLKRYLRPLILTLLLLYVGITYIISGMIIEPPERRTTDRSAEILQEVWSIDLDSIEARLPEPEQVEIESQDGLALFGFHISSPSKQSSPLPSGEPEGEEKANCMIIFAHGYSDNHSGTFKYSQLFDACQCDMLMINHRGHGLSEGELVTGGVLEALDFRRWHAYAMKRTGLPASKIGWVGESWGAATILEAASGIDEPPAFVLAESPYSSWHNAISERAVRSYGSWIQFFYPGAYLWCRLRTGEWVSDADALSAVEELEAPTIIFHSKADPDTHYTQSQEIYDAIPESTPSELHLLDWGSHHVHSVYDRPEAYRELFLAFLSEEVPIFCEE
ncbi:MAG: alpha/beta fold hydrolase [Bacteroidota bacterium]